MVHCCCIRDTKQKDEQAKGNESDKNNLILLPEDSSQEHLKKKQKNKKRLVPPFSYQSLQKNTKVYPPPSFDIFKPRKVKTTDFQKYYAAGLIPISSKPVEKAKGKDKVVENKEKGKKEINWTIPPQHLDYSYYLPIFFEGLAETTEPFKTMAKNGLEDLIKKGSTKILPVVPQLIGPIKKSMNTKNPEIMVETLKCIQFMVKEAECVGEALVPYYRQILQMCNLYRDHTVSTFDQIDTLRNTRMGDVIQDTLEVLEKYGGRHAYVNIKYMVPTYESAVMNC